MREPGYHDSNYDKLRPVDEGEILTPKDFDEIKKEYKEIERLAGTSLEEYAQTLIEKSENGDKYFVNFNGCILLSDKIHSVDDAYMDVFGVTYDEYRKSKTVDDFKRRQQKHNLNQAMKKLNE